MDIHPLVFVLVATPVWICLCMIVDFLFYDFTLTMFYYRCLVFCLKHYLLPGTDGVLWIGPSGTQIWSRNDQPHREGDLPAVIDTGSNQEWYVHGLHHRDDDKPSSIRNHDHIQKLLWHDQGKLSRFRGPAYVLQIRSITSLTIYWMYGVQRNLKTLQTVHRCAFRFIQEKQKRIHLVLDERLPSELVQHILSFLYQDITHYMAKGVLSAEQDAENHRTRVEAAMAVRWERSHTYPRELGGYEVPPRYNNNPNLRLRRR